MSWRALVLQALKDVCWTQAMEDTGRERWRRSERESTALSTENAEKLLHGSEGC